MELVGSRAEIGCTGHVDKSTSHVDKGELAKSWF